ncbi:MAG: hypothetical protein AAGB16_01610 [Pseudomonadota bacterium]
MKLLALGIFAIALSGAALAEDYLTVKKGKWASSQSIRTILTVDGETTQMPPEIETDVECWNTDEDTRLGPSMLGLDECTIVNAETTTSKLDLDLSCNFDGVPMNGDVTVTVSEDEEVVKGLINFSTEMNGASVTADGVLTAIYVGRCTG